MNKAVILGNGANREGMCYGDTLDIWACNLAFREDLNIHTLVSTDAHRQHQIYKSGYADNNRCIFLDWNKIPSGSPSPDFLQESGFKIISNDYTEHGVVVSGWNEILYYTYLNEKDSVETIVMDDLPQRFSTGGTAMWLAAKEGYKEILLAGFGDTNHAYREYVGGPDVPHVEIWSNERKYIMDIFSDVKWRYI